MHAMVLLFESFPYLGAALLVLLICLVAFVLNPAQRRLMALSGLCAAPYALWGIVYVPDYWKPNLVGGFELVGVEDYVAGFALGAVVWLAAAWPAGECFSLSQRPFRACGRYLALNTMPMAISLPLLLTGIKPLHTFLLAALLVGVFVIYLRRELWLLSVSGAVSFTVVYALGLKATFVIWPHFVWQWTSANLCGIAFWGMPLEELGWAFVTGAVWPLAMCFVFDARPLPGPRSVLT